MYRDKLYKGRRQSKKKSAIIIKWPNSSRKATQLWDTDDVPDLDGDDGLDDGGRDTPLQEARAWQGDAELEQLVVWMIRRTDRAIHGCAKNKLFPLGDGGWGEDGSEEGSEEKSCENW